MIRIDEKFNWPRVIIGGIFAGIAMGIVGYFFGTPSLGPREFVTTEGQKIYVDYEYLRDKGLFVGVPIQPFFWIRLILGVFLGILLGWIYAVARHRLGRGPKTAILVALIMGFIAAVPSALFQAAWNPAPYLTSIWQRWLLAGYAEVFIGTFIAAAIYKEEDEEVDEVEEGSGFERHREEV